MGGASSTSSGALLSASARLPRLSGGSCTPHPPAPSALWCAASFSALSCRKTSSHPQPLQDKEKRMHGHGQPSQVTGRRLQRRRQGGGAV